jgi:hypothetical protein
MFKAILLIALTAPSMLWGQKEENGGPERSYTITDGAAIWSQMNHTFMGNANFTGVVAAADCVYESTWVHRIDAAGSETAFGAPGVEVPSGATANSTWAGLGGSGLNAEEFMQIVDDGGPSGRVRKVMTLTNTTAAPITVNLYYYIDIDAMASFGTDTASYAAGVMTISEAAHTVLVEAPGHDNWQIDVFDASRFGLNTAGITNLTNSGSVVNDDFMGAFQWLDRTINPDESLTFTVNISSNSTLPVELERISID